MSSNPSSPAPASKRSNHSRRPNLPAPPQRTWLRLLLPLGLTALPLLIGGVIWLVRSQPHRQDLVIATSVPGGRHRPIAISLIDELNRSHRQGRVIGKETNGSLENLRLLQYGKVDFALYQTGTDELMRDYEFRRMDLRGESDGTPPDGFLSVDEFSSIASSNGSSITAEASGDIFHELDLNRDKLLSFDEFDNTESIRFVANLYDEVVHIIVRKASGISSLQDCVGKRVALGHDYSGDFASSRLVLEHCHIRLDDLRRFPSDQADPSTLQAEAVVDYYQQLTDSFLAKELDAAILTVGLHADRIRSMLEQLGDAAELLPVPFPEGLVSKDFRVTQATIPAGVYRGQERPIETVALKAQLLTRSDVDPVIVQQVTATVLSGSFQKRNRLGDLYLKSYAERMQYASSLPEFEVHPGATRVYDAEEFNLEQFQNLEAMYSLVASLLIAVFFVGRSVVKRHQSRLEFERQRLVDAQKELLDNYLERTMAIERRQVDENCPTQLQQYLNEVTNIKLEALSELTHEDLRGDRTFSIFLLQCANLIGKIQFKLLYSAQAPSRGGNCDQVSGQGSLHHKASDDPLSSAPNE